MTTPPIPQSLIPYLRHNLEPQQAFAYPRDSWSRWLSHIPEVKGTLEELPDSLDRQLVVKTVAELLPTNPAAAFTTAMIWGHGKTGYGAFRTASILSNDPEPQGKQLSDDTVTRLSTSAEIANKTSAVEAYRYLNNGPGKIENLGPAFFTKWLYFVTAQGKARSKSAAPILDALIINWLRENRVIKLRTARTDDYEKYLNLLKAWGAQYDLTPVHVEEAIFTHIRNNQ